MNHPRHRERGEDGHLATNALASPAGTWLRLERQIRPTNRAHFRSRSALESADLRAMFLGHWRSLLDRPSITVCSPAAARSRVSNLLDANAIGPQTASRLVGQIAAAAEFLDPRLFGSHQALAARLIEHGIVLAGDFPTSHSVELKPLLATAAACWPRGER